MALLRIGLHCWPATVVRAARKLASSPLAASLPLHPCPACLPCIARCSLFAEARAAALGQTLDGVLNTELEGLDSDAEARRWGPACCSVMFHRLIPSGPDAAPFVKRQLEQVGSLGTA